MWRWAIRSFFDERASLSASAGGVGVVFLLVLILEGAFAGEANQMVALIERSDAAVWVMQKGVSNMHMANSAMSEDVLVAVRRVEGVAHAEPILYGGVLAKIGSTSPPVYLVGVRPGQRTGPWDVARGRGSPGRGESVIPEALARRAGVGVGTTIDLGRQPSKVVGLSRGTHSMANSLVFVHAADLAALYDIVADANYVLVWGRPGVSPGALAARIRSEVPDVSVVERERFIANDRALALQMGGELIGIMTFVAGLVAALIVGFTVFTFAARRARELAVAKAVGAGGVQLLGAAVLQSLALTVLGYALAVGLAGALQPIFARYAPGVIIHFTAASVARTGLAALVVAALAGALPAWRVWRVDPAMVFSS